MFKKVLLLILLVSLALIGCSDSSDSTANPVNENETSTVEDTGSNTTETENTVKTDEEIRKEELQIMAEENKAVERGNVLTMAVSSFDGEFNPVLYDSEYDSTVCDLVFNGLIKVNKNAEFVPDIATWEVSDDRRTYTFKITPGVKFHNGTELTARDVAFTYYTIADPSYDGPRGTAVSDIVGVKAYRAGDTDNIRGIKIIDEYTISFTIEVPKVNKISDFEYGILSADYYAYESIQDLKELNLSPMGTGPMKFERYEPGYSVELSSYDDYFLGRAKIDGVVLRVISEATVASAVNAGEVDVARVPANLENYDTMTESGIINVQEYLGNSYRYIGFNLRLDKFSDRRVRQALWYGLNLEKFIDAQWEGFAAPCLGPISPVSWAYPDASELNDYAYNPEKALSLLNEAGWYDTDGDGVLDKDGEKFVIHWTSYDNINWPINLITVAKQQWGELGIEVESDLMEFSSVLDLVYEKQDFEMFNMAWALAVDPDPTQIFGEDADILGGYNAIGFHHERANEIFRLANEEYDQAKRAALYHEWAKIANEEVPYIFISIGTVINGVNQRVHNLELDTFEDMANQILQIELDYLN
ncbi:hypothetical protein EZV73_22535 [Acidaminobacter sp. JC074]|uniref:ABC transporter substrate-binding protein n=1 Tax=Acidaminobacter sp. JC074 TaxID=2530199 RepID=UPI001F117B45|nr:ABC transporter substrate-binding protein [Acidaminobacter sp. JC074]MCH4890378.1 hypothetical protein [Acidaminobacter sp. JC074]